MKKNLKSGNPVWAQTVEMQKQDETSKNTDVHFLCRDGFVPAHAFFIQSFSSFFQQMFLSQGESYPGLRNVIMPDYCVSDVQKTVQLIYSGLVNVENEKDAEIIKSILSIWKIECKNLRYQTNISTSEKANKVLYYLYEENKEMDMDKGMNQEETIIETANEMSNIKTTGEKSKLQAVDDCENDGKKSSSASDAKSSSPSKENRKKIESGLLPDTTVEMRSLRPRSALKKKTEVTKDSSEDEDEEFAISEQEEENDSSSVEDSETGPRRKTRGASSSSSGPTRNRATRSTPDNKSTSKISKIITSDNDDNSMSSSSCSESDFGGRNRKRTRLDTKKAGSVIPTPQRSRSSGASPVASTSTTTPDLKAMGGGQKSDASFDSDSDCNDKEISVYKSSKLFAEAARICGKCKKKYLSPKEASDCITEKHKLVRCYLCLGVCESTEKLFQHYAMKHNKAERENTLVCPFCSAAVSFKSISTHVISNHLFSNVKNTNTTGSAVRQAGRPASNMPSASSACQKRLKVGNASQGKNSEGGRTSNTTDSDSDDSEDNEMVTNSNMVIKKRSASGHMKTVQL